MKGKLNTLFALLAIVALLLASCAQATPEPTEEPPPPPPTSAPEPTEPPPPTEAPAMTEEPTPEPTEEVVGETYKIGFAPAITGPGSSLGAPEHETGQMIAEQLNAQGGVVGPDGVRHPVEIVIFDTETNPDVAVSVVRRMIEEENELADSRTFKNDAMSNQTEKIDRLGRTTISFLCTVLFPKILSASGAETSGAMTFS